MSDSFIQVAPDSTGKKIDSEQLTVGAENVERQRVQLVGALAAQIAAILNAEPAADAYGLAVRDIPVPLKVVTATDPAQGVGTKIIAPPAGKYWKRIVSGHFHLETDSTPGNRSVLTSFQDASANPYHPTGPNAIQNPNFTCSYCYMAGINPGNLTANNDGVHLIVPLAVGLGLPAGGAMIILVTGIQSGDQISDIAFLVEERDA